MTPPQKKRRLGRGLSALVGDQIQTKRDQMSPAVERRSAPAPVPPVALDIAPAPATPEASPEPSDRVVQLPLEQILPGKHQPRANFDEAALASLAESIRAVGVIQPVVVRPGPDGLYELVAGERRVRASKLAGLETVPAVIRVFEDRIAAESALIENLQREDLNPIERSEALRGLIEGFGLTQQQVAERVGLDRSSVSNLLRLSELEQPIQDLLIAGAIGLGHGKALLSATPGEARVRLANMAAREGWSVRRTEQEAKARPGGVPPAGGAATRAPSPDMDDLERRLGEHLGTKVRVHADRHGRGTLTIRFFGLDHFDDVMSRIGYRGDDDVVPERR